MYGVIDFTGEPGKRGSMPILGCEVYVAPGSVLTESTGGEDRYYHLVLFGGK